MVAIITDYDHSWRSHDNRVYSDHPEEDALRTIGVQLMRAAAAILTHRGHRIIGISGGDAERIIPDFEKAGFMHALGAKAGTEVWWRRADGSYQPDAAYAERLTRDFDAGSIRALALAWFTREASSVIATPHLEPHPTKHDSPAKVSFWLVGVNVHDADHRRLGNAKLAQFAAHLHAHGYRACFSLSSIKETTEKQRFAQLGYNPDTVTNFDILHADAGKDAALVYIMHTILTHTPNAIHLAPAYAKQPTDYHLIVNGDGGNDAAMFQAEHTLPNGTPLSVHAIAPSNADGHILQLGRALPRFNHAPFAASAGTFYNLVKLGFLHPQEPVFMPLLAQVPLFAAALQQP